MASYLLLKQAIANLAGVCDGAVTRDDVGFNGGDAMFGHFLASRQNWKRKWATKAFKMIQKYKNTQLTGIDFSQIPNPETELDEISSPNLSIDDLYSLNWSEPKFIAKLSKYVRSVGLPEGFWDLWKLMKEQIKAKGFGCSQYSGEWQLSWWTVNEDPFCNEVIVPAVEIQKPIQQITKIEDSDIIEQSFLYSYQKPHAQAIFRALTENNVALDTSDMGTGKTFCALHVAKALNRPIFVICPKAVIPSWRRSIAEMETKYGSFQSIEVVNYELIKSGKVIRYKTNKKGFEKSTNVETELITVSLNEKKGQYETKWVIKWNLPKDALLVFDEAHRCKNKDTINTQLLTACKGEAFKILLLSGTIAESPMKMYGVGMIMGFFEEPWEYYTKFLPAYNCRKERVSRYATAWIDHSTTADMVRIANQIGSRMHGMKKADLRAMGLFPNSQIIAEELNMNGNGAKIQELYEAIAEKLADLKAKENFFRGKGSEAHLQIVQKELQQIELLKIPAMLEFYEDLIENNCSVVIFVNYVDTVKEFCAQLGTDCTFYGQNSAEVNESNRAKFERNESRVIICNMAAAKEGIDLHDKAHTNPRVALITPNYSAQVLKQVLGRVDRAGGTDTTQYICFAANTQETDVCARVKGKLAKIAALNEGIETVEDLF
jgi:superfamily II DNA or RNA helicase